MADYFLFDLAGPTGEVLVETIGRAIAEQGRAASRQLQAVAEVFVRQLADPGDLRAAHQKVGELAQDSVKRSYDQLITAREGWAARQHYRRGASDWHRRRFAGGVLRRALADDDFFEATAEGLAFINEDMLNRKAAQWRRLAFGAGAAGEGAHERIQVTWGGLVVATLSLEEPASEPFVLPPGIWLGPEGGVRSGANAPGSDMFYPTGEARAAGITGRHFTRRSRWTRGIEGRNFFAAGLRRMGRELPVVYGQLYREWWDQAKAGVGPLTQTSVTARPVTLRSGIRSL